MKNNLGVTMVELVAVIVILLILATFAFNSGIDTLDEADVTEVLTEMTSVKKALASLQIKKEMDEETINLQNYYDENLKEEYFDDVSANVWNTSGDWYIIYGVDNDNYNSSDSKEVRKNLGLDSLNHTYVVNFNTSEVELYQPVTVKGLEVRTYEEVRSLAEK